MRSWVRPDNTSQWPRHPPTEASTTSTTSTSSNRRNKRKELEERDVERRGEC